jgi:hypothetical protein
LPYYLFLPLTFLWKDFKGRKPASKFPVPVTIKPVAAPRRSPASKRRETGLYEGDILDELSKTTLHILFGVMSGGGKSTSMKAIIWRIHQYNPAAQFFIVDPKTTDWLGLQRYPHTVTYLSGDVLDQLIQLKTVTEKVFNILDKR